MPRTTIVFFQEADETVPALEWLRSLTTKARDKCVVRLERLAKLGHELRRPEADLLRDKIYELRIGLRGENYRILYFFHGNTAPVISHGLIKEREVPPKEIDQAVQRRQRFEQDPKNYTYQQGKQ